MKTAKKIKCLTFYIKFFHTFERITLNETYWHNFFIIHVCQLSLLGLIMRLALLASINTPNFEHRFSSNMMQFAKKLVDHCSSQ